MKFSHNQCIFQMKFNNYMLIKLWTVLFKKVLVLILLLYNYDLFFIDLYRRFLLHENHHYPYM